MSDTRGPTAAANKLAMSKALGAAFLNHQVEQLEKSVSANGPSGNWRDRRSRAPAQDYPRGGEHQQEAPERCGSEDGREKARNEYFNPEKEADVIVVDASVLVHALPHVKKWCRDGRQEVVIVPLEGMFRHSSPSIHHNPSFLFP
ncbi:hypothetical protein NM688_g8864 [Phlebia brevispora]|uniref:Uncharacterized protein n=1 Tax=Phlebia brevispora TaxID=194682 RepID=A0ACC1RNW0_9APHY|nr:hypothetical protein NM688_g8864 [Phlebia brevispora]